MLYANANCTFIPDGDSVKITGPYHDDPARSRTVTVKKSDLEDYKTGHGPKRYIQNAFPYLSADDREFLLTGISPEGWEKAFGEEK